MAVAEIIDHEAAEPLNPLGSIAMHQTDNGIEFRVAVYNINNTLLALALACKSIAVAYVLCDGIGAFLGVFLLLSLADAMPLYFLSRPKFATIEVRPDGFTFDGRDFYNRDSIIKWRLSPDQGFILQYGVHALRPMPPIADEAEFRIFRSMLEKCVASVWFQQNPGSQT